MRKIDAMPHSEHGWSCSNTKPLKWRALIIAAWTGTFHWRAAAGLEIAGVKGEECGGHVKNEQHLRPKACRMIPSLEF